MDEKYVQPPPYSPQNTTYPPSNAASAPLVQPPLTPIHQATTVVNVGGGRIGGCPVCQSNRWTGTYSCCAWLLCLLCFPCGIICCLCMRKKKCSSCGFTCQ